MSNKKGVKLPANSRRKYRLLHDIQNVERMLIIMEARAQLYTRNKDFASAESERLKMVPWAKKQKNLLAKYMREYAPKKPSVTLVDETGVVTEEAYAHLRRSILAEPSEKDDDNDRSQHPMSEVV